MCTSLTLETRDKKHLLGRTMDFWTTIGECVEIIPKNLKWKSTNKELKSKYATVGMAVVLDGHPVLSDGVNEKGLACATLYFPGFAYYEKDLRDGKENIVQYDINYYILSEFSSVEEVKREINKLNIVEKNLEALKTAPPLHWIITDKTGECIVIEKIKDGLNIIENKIGVMTNSPNLEWHITNLRQYIGLTPKYREPLEISGVELKQFGQGSGTFSLPGDFTPASRFIRATYLKNTIQGLEDEKSGINGIFRILENCSVVKGAVVTDRNLLDYTVYKSAICVDTQTYYYSTYENPNIQSVKLEKKYYDSKEIIKFN